MNRVLITGGKGWLGKYLVSMVTNGSSDYKFKNYTKRNSYLRVTDLTVTTIEESISSFPDYIIADITKWEDCIKITKDIDTVIHIAGIIHPKKTKQFYDINTRGTDNLVRASIDNGVKKFIYISSNSAYGDREYTMMEYTTPIPYMDYGRSKYLAESCVEDNMDYIESVILRPCWFYGENPPNRLIKLFKMIKKGNPIIFGDGNNLRSMSYIGNVCHAILKAIEYDPGYTQDFWIADSRIYTTNEIYYTIADLLEIDIKPRYIPGIVSSVCRLGDKLLQKLGRYNSYIHVAGEMDRNIACSIYKARRELGYNPIIDLKEGMRRTIEWCKGHGKL